MAIDAIMCCLPLLGANHVVLLDHVLDPIGRGQDLLMVLLGICLDTTDLGSMSSPFCFSIIHLKRSVRRAIKSLLVTLLTWDSSFIILGRKRKAMAVPCQIA